MCVERFIITAAYHKLAISLMLVLALLVELAFGFHVLMIPPSTIVHCSREARVASAQNRWVMFAACMCDIPGASFALVVFKN